STHGTYRPIGAGLARMITRLGRDGRATLFVTVLLAGGLPQNAAAEPITEFTLPTLNSGPNGITLAPTGDLGVAATNDGKLGRIRPAGAIEESAPIATANAQPWDITMGPDGALWFTESLGNKIGRYDGTFREFSIPTSSSFPFHITLGPDGNLWFAEDFAG